MSKKNKICVVCAKSYDESKLVYDFVMMNDCCLLCVYKSMVYPNNSGLHFGRDLRNLLEKVDNGEINDLKQ